MATMTSSASRRTSRLSRQRQACRLPRRPTRCSRPKRPGQGSRRPTYSRWSGSTDRAETSQSRLMISLRGRRLAARGWRRREDGEVEDISRGQKELTMNHNNIAELISKSEFTSVVHAYFRALVEHNFDTQ